MNRKDHIRADESLLGYSIPLIHVILDAPVGWLDAGHRSIHHNIQTIKWIEEMFGKEGKYIALLHIMIDNRILDWELIKFINSDMN